MNGRFPLIPCFFGTVKIPFSKSAIVVIEIAVLFVLILILILVLVLVLIVFILIVLVVLVLIILLTLGHEKSPRFPLIFSAENGVIIPEY